MTDWSKKKQRREDVKSRAARPDWEASYCKVIGCGKPARAATGDGLDRLFCRSHADHYSRHGSPYKSSYTAAELHPHRQEARKWLMEHRAEPMVQNALDRVQGLYQRAGRHVEAFRLRGLPPEDRARAAWARLRKAQVDPIEVIAAWLAVEAMIRADPQPDSKTEFKLVQAAKLVHRMASGTHKRWEKESGAVEEMHMYPRPRGKVLRHIGRDLQGAVEMLSSLASCPQQEKS